MIIGLTGGIGAGKSTLTNLYDNIVFDCDAQIHKLYKEPEILEIFRKKYPVIRDNEQNLRKIFSEIITKNPGELDRIGEMMMQFLEEDFNTFCLNKDLVICDAPLLFEKSWDKKCDYSVTISVPQEIRWNRVKDRPNMSREKFEAIISKQLTEKERNQKADFVIDGTLSKEKIVEEFNALIVKLTNNFKI